MSEPIITIRHDKWSHAHIFADGWSVGIINRVTKIEVKYRSTEKSWISLYGKNGYMGVILGVFDYGQPGIER